MTSESQSPYCHKCGAQSREDGLFCHKCGASLNLSNSLEEFGVKRPPEGYPKEKEFDIEPGPTQKMWPEKKSRSYFIGLLALIIIAVGVYLISRSGETSPNLQAAYASDPNKDGSIASLIVAACDGWTDLKSGPDISIEDKAERDTDYEYRKTTTSVGFDRLWLVSSAAAHSNVYQYLSDSLLNIGVDPTLVETSDYPDIEIFCSNSLEDQIAPYLATPGLKDAKTSNTSEPSGKNQTKPETQLQATTQPKPVGHWEMKCTTMEYPNPNYDPYKGPSAIVNEPTVKTQSCSQVWVTN